MEIPEDIPAAGAVIMFGGSKFGASQTSCFWLKANAVTSAACGDEHTALITEKGKVYVFGSNNWGQLGLGHTQAVEKPTCVKSLSNESICLVACGRNHTLVATVDNKLFGFGNNNDSQLAIQSITNCENPTRILNLPSDKIKKIGAGADFSVVLFQSGNVYVWGSNADGQLGLGDINESEEPARLDIDEEVVDIACGYYHTAIVTASGKLYTFGEDEFGKLGKRVTTNNSFPNEVILPPSTFVKNVACGGSHTAFVSKDGNLFTFGGGFRGELGHGENIMQSEHPKLVDFFKDKIIESVDCGENFSCCIEEGGWLYSFGDGRNGKLGLEGEDFSNQFFPIACQRLRQYSVKFAVCGGCHVIVLMKAREANIEATVHPKRVGLNDSARPLNSDEPDAHLGSEIGTLNLSLRSSVAREKRRKARDVSPAHSHTLPALSTLKSHELMEAVKSFPKLSSSQETPTAHTTKSSHRTKELDETSDISTLNRVHKIVTANGETAFVPVTHSQSFNDDDQSQLSDETDPEEDLSANIGFDTTSHITQSNTQPDLGEESNCSEKELDHATDAKSQSTESKTAVPNGTDTTIENLSVKTATNGQTINTTEAPETQAKSSEDNTNASQTNVTTGNGDGESGTNSEMPSENNGNQNKSSEMKAEPPKTKKSKFCTIL